MCGLFCLISDEPVDPRTFISSTLRSLAHRGPNNSGYAVLDGGRVIMGHTRLSIVDASDSSNQPFFSECKTICLVFNGEIYNYKALRAELEAVGRVFRTKSDSEVLVKAWEEWQFEFVRRLEGIFALVLWDDRTRTLFASRDHLGIKPLYYAQDKGYISFASQPRAFFASRILTPKVNLEAVLDFLSFGYVPAPKSAFTGVTKFPPASWLVYSKGNFNLKKYWEFPKQDDRICYEDAFKIVEERFSAAVNAEVPEESKHGVFLSGGLDSSLLVAALSKSGTPFATYSLGFLEQESDERDFARRVANAFATSHHEALITNEGISRALSLYQFAYDEPFDLNGALPMLTIAERASSDSIKVMFGGDGADELFYGYTRYEKLSSKYLHESDSRMSTVLHDFYSHEGTEIGGNVQLMNSLLQSMNDKEYSPYDSLGRFFDSEKAPPHAARDCDLSHYMIDNILCKVDRATMAFGIETRVPFLNKAFVEAIGKIPKDILFKNNERKFLLRDVARKFLSPELIDQRKKGFSCPLPKWTNADFIDRSRRLINNGYLIGSETLRGDWENSEIFCDLGSEWRSVRVFWLILALELWARRWILNEEGLEW